MTTKILDKLGQKQLMIITYKQEQVTENKAYFETIKNLLENLSTYT